MQAMVVDDSKAMRMIVGKFLRELGFSVIEATHGQEALSLLQQNIPSLMMIDWNMPEMNGIDLIKTIRQHPAYKALCLVMVTTEIETQSVSTALAAGANEYLMKPFTRESLREKLLSLALLPNHKEP